MDDSGVRVSASVVRDGSVEVLDERGICNKKPVSHRSWSIQLIADVKDKNTETGYLLEKK